MLHYINFFNPSEKQFEHVFVFSVFIACYISFEQFFYLCWSHRQKSIRQSYDIMWNTCCLHAVTCSHYNRISYSGVSTAVGEAHVIITHQELKRSSSYFQTLFPLPFVFYMYFDKNLSNMLQYYFLWTISNHFLHTRILRVQNVLTVFFLSKWCT